MAAHVSGPRGFRLLPVTHEFLAQMLGYRTSEREPGCRQPATCGFDREPEGNGEGAKSQVPRRLGLRMLSRDPAFQPSIPHHE